MTFILKRNPRRKLIIVEKKFLAAALHYHMWIFHGDVFSLADGAVDFFTLALNTETEITCSWTSETSENLNSEYFVPTSYLY